MRILFVYNGAESLGVESISALLKSRGHEVALVYDPSIAGAREFSGRGGLPEPGRSDRRLLAKAAEFRPDLAGFSCFSNNYRWSLGLAREIKRTMGIPVVFGGVHPTAVPEKVLANDFVDFVVRGEGEFAMLDLVEHLARKDPPEKLLETPNLCFRHGGAVRLNPPRPYIKDLDSLPLPDKRLFFEADPLFAENTYLIVTSRGCPYACTYCSNCMYQELYAGQGPHVRRRSADSVIKELACAKAEWKPERIHFLDDVFTSSPEWLRGFIDKYTENIGIPFYCYVNPLNVTEETAALLGRGGCYLAGIGVQSGSERVRREDYGRFDTNERIERAVAMLKANGIGVQADNILGAPSETEEDLKRSLELYRKIRPDIIINFWMTYYPRTKIVAKARERGLISDEDIARVEEGFIGYTHDIGSLGKRRAKLFRKYELLIELSCLCGGDGLFSLLSAAAPFIPFKKAFSHLIYLYTGVRLGLRAGRGLSRKSR